MALPVLNDKPQYTMTIPSTGKKVKFRPYLVKEEKILLIAAQAQDVKTMMETIVDTILCCTDNKVKKENLTTFDVEYMFLKIRSKSVGEIAEIGVKCTSCDTTNKVSINLEEVEAGEPEATSNIVQITDDISVEMKWPSYTGIDYVDDETELGFRILSQCMKTVITPDNRMDLEDETPESIRTFLESMTKDQFEAVSNYIEYMPQVTTDIHFVCDKCHEHNTMTVKGMQSFF